MFSWEERGTKFLVWWVDPGFWTERPRFANPMSDPGVTLTLISSQKISPVCHFLFPVWQHWKKPKTTSTFSQRKGRASQPSITFASQAKGGWGGQPARRVSQGGQPAREVLHDTMTTMMTQTWLHETAHFSTLNFEAGVDSQGGQQGGSSTTTTTTQTWLHTADSTYSRARPKNWHGAMGLDSKDWKSPPMQSVSRIIFLDLIRRFVPVLFVIKTHSTRATLLASSGYFQVGSSGCRDLHIHFPRRIKNAAPNNLKT